MSDEKVTPIRPEADEPRVRWPGHVALDRRGVELAVEMLDDLGETETNDPDGLNTSDRACIDDWPRQGKPHRNVFFEYLQRAREAGPAAEDAFCAIAGDFVGLALVCGVRNPDDYAETYGIE